MSSNIFKLDVSLEKLAGIAVAISFWEKPDVKKKIHRDSNEFCYDPNSNKDTSRSQKIIHYIFKQLDLLNFPAKLLDGIKILVIKIGKKIYSWMEYVTKTLGLTLKYAEKIYWTSYGDIDELKILQRFWLTQPKLEGGLHNANCCFMNNKLFCIATKYAQREFVYMNINHFKQQIFPYLNLTQQKQDWTPYAIIATWILFCTSEKKTSALQIFRGYKGLPDKLPANDLFKRCVTHNFEFAAKYFWKRIKMNERQTLAVSTVESLLSALNHACKTDDFNWKREKQLKMLLFFINEMTEIQKIQFIMKRFFDLFKLCLLIWPYQELCAKFINEIVDHVTDQHCRLLRLIIEHLTCDEKDGKSMYFTSKKCYYDILKILMEKISKKVKEEFFIENKYKNVNVLYQTLDFKSVTLVINDPDLKEFRKDLLDIGINYFKQSVLQGNFEDINKFIENMNFGKEELKLFKQKLNVLNSFLIRGEIDEAEQHLNWLANSNAQKNELKNQVNPVDLCYIFLQNNKFKAAQKFLEWRFNQVKERENVKEILKSDGFVEKKIFQIWGSKNSNIETVLLAEESTRLLHFFFKSEGEITKFKKEFVQDECLVESYWDALFYKKSFQNFNDFLKFFLFTSNEIKTLNKDIGNKINWWIDNFALEKSKFLMIDNLLDWIYSDKESKKNVIKNYMSSTRGCLLCVKVFKNYQKSDPNDIIQFFNSWVDKSLDIGELKMQLGECCLVEPNVIKCIKFLLKRRGHGKHIRESHLSEHLTFNTICGEKHYNYDPENSYDQKICKLYGAEYFDVESSNDSDSDNSD